MIKKKDEKTKLNSFDIQEAKGALVNTINHLDLQPQELINALCDVRLVHDGLVQGMFEHADALSSLDRMQLKVMFIRQCLRE